MLAYLYRVVFIDLVSCTVIVEHVNVCFFV